ncbi:MAG TPA: hypothetical protein VGN63_19685 [Flavisolibacter sp.]|jgi:hypothetical protein|nr:hypothetical protein [Flavisolibacter sp.]
MRVILLGMARQTGPVKITGTIDDICFYKMEGDYFARRKSSLSGKRFWKDRVFAGSRRSSGLLGAASPLASRLYRQLPKEKKGRPQFQQLVGSIRAFLQKGCTEAWIASWFAEHYLAESRHATLKEQGQQPKKQRVVPVRKVFPGEALSLLRPTQRAARSFCGRKSRRGRKHRTSRIRELNQFYCTEPLPSVLPAARAGWNSVPTQTGSRPVLFSRIPGVSPQARAQSYPRRPRVNGKILMEYRSVFDATLSSAPDLWGCW